MKNIATILALFAGSWLSVAAQVKKEIQVDDPLTGKKVTVVRPEGMLTTADSLLMQWSARQYLQENARPEGNRSSVEATPDIYQQRLQRLPTVIEMSYNDVVKESIEVYTKQLDREVAYYLGAGNFYIPLFEEILDREGLPLELKYLPMVVSGLQPQKHTATGQAGLWQLPLAVAQRYGLEVNSLLDERCDVYKSTEAAARYLKDLYDIYNDWSLVLAAYGSDPASVNKAMHREDGAKGYWTLYPKLPATTRGFYPSFIAANYVMNYYCEHQIRPMQTKAPVKTDTVMVNRNVHMQQIAAYCKIDIAALHELNPQYRTDVIPGASRPCPVRMPLDKLLAFVDNQDSIYQYHAKELLTRRAVVAQDHPDEKKAKAKARKEREEHRAKYVKVRNGDTLGAIARRNHTTVAKIKRLNGMRSDRINPGKRLRVR